ncbi:MAG: FAD-dependent oxidoreductase [Ignavibacteriales bacterium]|nr:FAD-dependent oxidoreductase [Ignavibacteriales bacterium]
MTTELLQLQIPGFDYYDLYNPVKLAELTEVFYGEVRSQNPELFQQFDKYRKSKGENFSPVEISNLLVELAPYLNNFIAKMFGVENEMKAKKLFAEKEHIVFKCKKEFFTRRVLKKFSSVEQTKNLDIQKLDTQISSLKKGFRGIPNDDAELEIAAMVLELWEIERFIKDPLTDERKNSLIEFSERLKKENQLAHILPLNSEEAILKNFLSNTLSVFEQWLAYHYHNETDSMKRWATFKQPKKIEYEHLVELNVLQPNFNIGVEKHYRQRDGFDLTDERYSPREVMSEVDYCIFCHDRNKDSCSKGIHDNGSFKKNPLEYELKGCPLDQKISESQAVENNGDVIGALAIIMIDNPLCPGTGHRICNDCMKACIYQKQEPVNIPQIETRVLTDVLNLPWGFEIYSLLTRWNPINIERPHILPFNGKKILVVGLGPAGYTMAHYLLNEGFAVVGIDGLKIEPLSVELVGDEKTKFKPLKHYSSIEQKLSERVLMGFGGVSEYGITVRWDKNFLTVIYLTLLRREMFRVYDGIRFGGTITVEDAWELGFDHVCFATGAGKPTFVTMKNNLIRGIRKASDFLMALQLTGAGKKDSMANLQVQLPALVIGGGLTAIDTATELFAYYPIQVTKIKNRYEKLCSQYGKEIIDGMYNAEEKNILSTYLKHAEEIERERERAKKSNERPNFIPLIRQWGGVHLYYRKSMNDAPAYRLNHEEIIKAFEEGISFVEKMSPLEAVPDESGALKEMVFEKMELVSGKWKSSGEAVRVAAKSLMVAAGTVPNVMYERENPGTFELDKWNEFFQSHKFENGKLVQAENNDVGFFTSYEKNGKFVTFYGDNHPVYEGNVVKAMASAKNGYKKVVALFNEERRAESIENGVMSEGLLSEEKWSGEVNKKVDSQISNNQLPITNYNVNLTSFFKTLNDELKPYVVKVERLTPTITEIIVHAPMQARKFLPGQFFRLQNYETDSLKLENTLLMMEGVALTGAWVEVEKGLLSMIILEVGASSRMASMLKPNQRVVVMGPTGTPTEIPENSTVLLLGGGLGNAVLFSIAKAAKEKNTKVIYFAGYKKKEDFFKREEIESATDVVVYSVDSGEPIPARRLQDKSFVGNIIQAMLAYASGKLGEITIPLGDAVRVIAIGSDRMMAAVAEARSNVLKPYLHEEHVGIASINSPMQCMMKAICAQCLQRHVNKETGKEEFVFSCVNQDQCMDDIDFQNLNSRLKANNVMEKITNKWLEYIFEKHKVEHV